MAQQYPKTTSAQLSPPHARPSARDRSGARGHPAELAVHARHAGIVHELPDPLGGVARAHEIRAWKDDGDLLAPVPAGEVELADGVGKDARDRTQHFVAGLVAVAVV